MRVWWYAITILEVASIVGAVGTLVYAPRVNIGEALMLDALFLMQWGLEIMGLNVIGTTFLTIGTVVASLVGKAFKKVKGCFTKTKTSQSDPPFPTTNDSIRKVSIDTADSFTFDSADCSICLGEISPSHLVYELPCSTHHRFHAECLEEWIIDHTTCPYCRGLFDPKTLKPTIES